MNSSTLKVVARKFFRENVFFLIIAFLPYYSGVGIVAAQTMPGEVSFFTEPLIVSRGKINPSSSSAEVWQKTYWCKVVKENWGWTGCDGVDAFIVSYNADVDTLLFESPNMEGRVTFDDWKDENLDDEISAIENSLKENLKVQSEQVKMPVTFAGWRVYPTLNEELKILYYATDVDWNGDISTNIKVSIFDRRGYVTMVIIPTVSNLSSAKIEEIVLYVASKYSPNPTESYDEFVTGDKVAAVGAVGVLAALVGVKYSKGFVAGLLLVLAAFAKKAWILILLPIYFIKKLFRRKE